jgi:hypothetical protein
MSLPSACSAYLQLQSERTKVTLKWTNTVRLMLQSTTASVRSLKFETADAAQSLDEFATKAKSIIERLDEESESGRKQSASYKRVSQLMSKIESEEAIKRQSILQLNQLELDQVLQKRSALDQPPDVERQEKIEELQSQQQESMQTINDLIDELRDEQEDAQQDS